MFYKKTIKELEHAIDETIDTANNAHERIGKISGIFGVKTSNLETAMKETQDALNELENHSKNKWEATTKRVETCEKANEMFIKALNEQRDVIGKIIKYLNNTSKTKTTTNSKKGAK